MDALTAERYPSVLVSYAYAETLRLIRHEPEFLMLDSGAFTAWTLGLDVSLEKFASWAQGVVAERHGTLVVSLDVIPGRPGVPPTAPERSYAMQASLENGDALRAGGLSISEVYHQHEPLSHLRKLLARQRPHEVLGISPNKSVSRQKRLAFVRQTLRDVLAETGREAFPRCHGLGVISRDLMLGFPFYSVDSSGWVVYRYGCGIDARGRSYAMDVRFATSRAGAAKRLASIETLRNLRTLEAEVTRYWDARGFHFTDPPGVGLVPALPGAGLPPSAPDDDAHAAAARLP